MAARKYLLEKPRENSRENQQEDWLGGRDSFSPDQENPTNTANFGTSLTKPSTYRLPFVACAFVHSPLFSDLPAQ
jgi:hypothetical protein